MKLLIEFRPGNNNSSATQFSCKSTSFDSIQINGPQAIDGTDRQNGDKSHFDNIITS